MTTKVSEKDVMLEIWGERPHVSEISGERLIEDKNHYLFWNQFAHCLPKSIGGRFRLRKDNIFLVTPHEHDLQTRYPGKTKLYRTWDKFWEKYDELKQEYHSGKT